MLRSISLLIISFAILTGCSNNDTIPEKDMVKILTKMHLIDGTLNLSYAPGEQSRLISDSVDYYSKMIESYGYTTTQFTKSYYYYLGRPELLDGIYDKIITKLELENQRIADSIDSESMLNQYWNLSSFWKIANKESSEKIEFSVPVEKKGGYTLKMVATIGSNDETPNLKAVVGTTSNNSTTVENLDNKQEVVLKKTGKAETYTFTINIPDNKPLFIKGRLLDYKSEPSKLYNRNVTIRKITLTSPADSTKKHELMKQDSLLR